IRARYPSAFDGPDEWVFHDHCFLVRTPTTLILFDTGAGGAGSPGARWLGAGGRLPDEVTEVGVDPGDVEVVAISHAHLDHVGCSPAGDGDEIRPRFPNARYALQRAEWEGFPAAGDDEDRAAFEATLRPLETLGVLALVDDAERLAEGVTLHLAA